MKYIIEIMNTMTIASLVFSLSIILFLIYIIYKRYELKKYKIKMITEYAIEKSGKPQEIKEFVKVLEGKYDEQKVEN